VAAVGAQCPLVVRRLLAVADGIALRHVARNLPTPLAKGASVLGRAAGGGRLWFGIAAALGLSGQTGRRAATAGLVSIGITSSIANGPAKWATRRTRPAGAVLAGMRRRGSSPSTSSFPSSHTASAFAFATAASLEAPALAPLLFATAAGVGTGRVRDVRHFPTDVLGGAVLGIAGGAVVGVAARKLRRRVDDEASG
jgi:membrane-associated phospholipid phosphatase